MKGTYRFLAFLALAVMLVMPPGNGYAHEKQTFNTQCTDIVQPDLSVNHFSPVILEVADNPSAFCTGELWVYSALKEQAMDVVLAARPNPMTTFIFKDKTLLTDINSKGLTYFEYGLRRTCQANLIV